MSSLLGAVLAGGGSRRFGEPKAAATVGGVPLVARALRAVGPVCGAVVLAGWQAEGSAPVPVLEDRRSDAGPLAGLEAALLHARGIGAPGVLLLACDLPGVGWPAVAALVRRWRSLPRPEAAALVLGQDQAAQPLCGVYGVELLPELETWLDGRAPGAGRSARAWVEGLAGAEVAPALAVAREADADPDDLLLNVNRPEDLVRAGALPAPPPPLVAVLGWKDTGKTTVAVKLVEALVRRGLRVVALKHGHGFDVDTPGTDSWRLRHQGGASRVILAGPHDHVVLGDWGPGGEPGLLELVRRHGQDADVVVAEGWKEAPVPAVEVRRLGGDDTERPPLFRGDAPDRDRFLALVASGPAEPGEPPRLHPDAPGLGDALARRVLDRLLPDRREA